MTSVPVPAIFVPGVLGAGLLLSLVITIADAIRATARIGRTARKERVVGERVANEIVGAPERDPGWTFRARRTYAVVGVAGIAIAIYVAIGSFWNFFNPSPGQNWAEDIAWLFAASAVSAAGFAAVGAVALRLALDPAWRSPILSWFLSRTPLGRREP